MRASTSLEEGGLLLAAYSYFWSESAIFIVRASCGLYPRFTERSRRKLCAIKPAATSRTSARAISPTTNSPRSRWCTSPPVSASGALQCGVNVRFARLPCRNQTEENSRPRRQQEVEPQRAHIHRDPRQVRQLVHVERRRAGSRPTPRAGSPALHPPAPPARSRSAVGGTAPTGSRPARCGSPSPAPGPWPAPAAGCAMLAHAISSRHPTVANRISTSVCASWTYAS